MFPKTFNLSVGPLRTINVSAVGPPFTKSINPSTIFDKNQWSDYTNKNQPTGVKFRGLLETFLMCAKLWKPIAISYS